jgi:hypothetical protein
MNPCDLYLLPVRVLKYQIRILTRLLFSQLQDQQNTQNNKVYKDREKTMPVQAWAGPEVSRRLKLPVFLDNRRMKVVRLSALRTHFCKRLSRHHGYSAAGRIMSIKNFSDTIGNGIRDLLAGTAVPQPTAPLRAPAVYPYVQHKIKQQEYKAQ